MFGHYLMFNRNCAEALELYANALNGTISEMQKYGDMPPNPAFPVAESDKDLVLHARLQCEDMEIMAADSPQRGASGSNMYITVTSTDKAYIEKAWNLLQQGGHIYMKLSPSFFAVLHGSLQDRFGTNWMFTVSNET
ncbi:MAG: VOC family protein [Treponema sp.]|jgi:PhnB protein|nr:VOC family protein [Treponema sp.]